MAELPFGATPGDYVKVEISDTGVGMPTEVADKAIDPFFTTKDVGEGTGLGLSMVYGFVKQSGGHMNIESTVGEGTSVSLYLPRSSDHAASRSVQEDKHPTQGKGTILVVEDNEQVCTAIANALNQFGYTVFKALDGPEALSVLDEIGRLDLLLTDVVMPAGINGFELAQVVKELKPGTKIIHLTARTDAEVERVGTPAEGERVLHKPVHVKEIVKVVAEVLGHSNDQGDTRH